MKHRSRLTPLYYLPFTIALGIGLTINNCRAVFEALFKKETPFVRTPKYNVNASDKDAFSAIMKNRYRMKKINWVSLIELGLGIYFSYAVYFAYYSGLHLSMPFLMLFQIGFLYTSFLSLFYTPVMGLLRKRV
jgi:hypothetical protein